MDSLRPLHKAGFTDVLDYGIQLFKKHFREIFLINLMFNLPIMLLLSFLNPIFTDQYADMFTLSENGFTNPGEAFSSMMTLYTMMFGTLALYAVHALTLKNILEGSIIKLIYSDVVLNQKRTVKQLIRECFGQFWQMMLGRFLYGLLMWAVIFVAYIAIVIVMLAGVFSAMGISTASVVSAPWISTVLGILGILLVLAGLFFMIIGVGYFNSKFWMFLPAICIEQKKAGSSIGRCGNLGKNGFYRLSLTYLVGALLTGLFPSILSTVITLINTVSGSMDITVLKIGSVATQVFSSLLQPLLTCIMTALYITLRVKREGLDMELTLFTIKKEQADKAQRWMAEAPNAAE